LGIDAEGAAVSWRHGTLHCPWIHTYSHTQKFSKINCVNSLAPLIARAIAGGWTRPHTGRSRLAIALTGFRAVSSDSPNVVADLLQSHINLLMFADFPLLAVFSRLLDVRGRFYLAEHLVLAAYTSSMRVLFATLILIPFWYVFRPSNPAAVALASLAIWALYFDFAASQFFPGRRALSWCRGFLTAVLASALMQGLIMLVASLFLRPEA
jgi:hypothetical protein